ncbi:MAG: undecaprenyl-diphosphate phosphatase [Bacteroidota bacterium]|nr:undecaprenyl-diphosphate phosphatase [Bacteroidota bacterium]MDX5429722.1 undecaprenyl-diphosphate phosphatase [Bacteroidota bacterium]MDX5468503.1 undecaprenyl-diphosphate phosphatase [Bacteroidota bacterium]
MSLLEVIVLAIIEGLTEFLPVSSTGHMIIASSVMGIANDDFVKLFTIAIQFGAILSVIVLYFKRFFKSIEFYLRLFIAFIPAAVIGFLLNDYIDALLENALVVALSLVIGGVILLFIDRLSKEVEDEEPSRKQSLMIGFFQCIAMIPGVSRSAATIIGGMAQGLNKKSAAEFSFFLAVPTMFAATVYKLYKFHKEVGFSEEHLSPMLIGNALAFVVALIAIKGFIGYVTKNGFRIFGWYRIILGGIILVMMALGYDLQMV